MSPRRRGVKKRMIHFTPNTYPLAGGGPGDHDDGDDDHQSRPDDDDGDRGPAALLLAQPATAGVAINTPEQAKDHVGQEVVV